MLFKARLYTYTIPFAHFSLNIIQMNVLTSKAKRGRHVHFPSRLRKGNIEVTKKICYLALLQICNAKKNNKFQTQNGLVSNCICI